MGIPNVTIVKVLYSNLDNLAEVMLGAEDRLATLLHRIEPVVRQQAALGQWRAGSRDTAPDP